MTTTPASDVARCQTGRVVPAAACDLCGSIDFEIVSQRDRRGQPLLTGVCIRCGLVRHLDPPSEAQLSRYYAEEYRHDYHGEHTPSPRRVLRAWRVGQETQQRLNRWLRPGMRTCDIGAGMGCTVRSMQLAGCDACGLEPNEGFERYGREVIGAALQRGNLFAWQPPARFELVTLMHVIEHFLSPRAALEQIARLLTDDGLLYVECPNLAAPFAPPAKMFHFAHVHNFTPATLTMLAARCGLRVEHAFTGRDNPEIKLLLRRTRLANGAIDPASYAGTMHALRRYNAVSYHLRADYLKRRIVKVGGYLREHLGTQGQLREILEKSRAA